MYTYSVSGYDVNNKVVVILKNFQRQIHITINV
jgi:hypothetical protein